MAAAITDTGMVSPGIRVARQELRNSSITTSTTPSAIVRALNTSRMDSPTNSEKSTFTSTEMSSGSEDWRSSTSSLTAWLTATMLAWACGTIPRLTPAWRLERAMERMSSGSSRMSATSARRTKRPEAPRPITSAPNSSGVSSAVTARRVNSRSTDSMRPAGSSTFSLRRVRSTSCTVRPRAASASRSSHTRIAGRRPPDRRIEATPSTAPRRSTSPRSA